MGASIRRDPIRKDFKESGEVEENWRIGMLTEVWMGWAWGWGLGWGE